MTIKRYLAVTFIQLIVLMALKVVFYRVFSFANPYVEICYWIATLLAAFFLVRKVGVIHYLEAFFTAGFWSVLDLIFDSFVTLPLAGAPIFSTRVLWIGYGLLILAVILVHKKRHVHIRQGQTHHGHH